MKDKPKISINDLVFIKAAHEFMENKKKFNGLRDEYVKQFKRVNNKNAKVDYAQGFVIITYDGSLSLNKYRIKEFETMLQTMSSRPDYVAPKIRVKKIFEGDINKENTDVEDGGQALITYIAEPTDTDNGMFIRIQSWDEQLKHEEFKKFEGRKIRITIETID